MSIQANELRMGNWVSVNGEPNEAQITNPRDFYNLDFFDPLPITEEWLRRFGFEKPTRNDPYGGFIHPIGDEGCTIRINPYHQQGFGYRSPFGFVKTEYVHQLQNLFFALSGTELKLE